MTTQTLFPDARAALRTHLKLVSGLPAAAYRAWEGFAFTPTRGKAFVTDRLASVHSTPRAIGAIEHGMTYTVTLVFPANEGTGAIEALAGAVVDQFKVGTKLTYGSHTVLCEKAERRGGIIQEPDWLRLTVEVRLWACTTE